MDISYTFLVIIMTMKKEKKQDAMAHLVLFLTCYRIKGQFKVL